MADITKCTGLKQEEKGTITCPMRRKCYRFLVPDGGPWQSYFCSTPLQWEPTEPQPSCEYFWELNGP